MNKHLKQFKEELKEEIIQLLWKQWDSLGATGQLIWSAPIIVDPDALLVFSCSLARYDARLFDEILDWLMINGRLLNVQRISNIVQKGGFRGGPVLSAIADVMNRRDASAKWTRLARMFRRSETAMDPLFFFADGEPMPSFGKTDPIFYAHGFVRGPTNLRGHTQAFQPERQTNLWMALRALLGVNARCEIILYLLLNGRGHARGIARETCFFQKTVQDALSEMGQSGFLHRQAKGRERIYALKPDAWKDLLGRGQPLPQWTNWPAVFSAMEATWFMITDTTPNEQDSLFLSARLNGLVHAIVPRLNNAGVSHRLEPRPVEDADEYVKTTLMELQNFVRGIS